MPEKVRFGVIGLDHWYSAVPFLEGIARHAAAELVAVHHGDRARAEAVAGRFNPAFADSPEAVLDRDDVEAVAVFLPMDRNAAICRAAAGRGRHVVAIKPMAMTLEDASSVAAAVRAAGVVFFPLESRGRLRGVFRRFKEWIQEGRIGPPLTAASTYRAPLPRDWPDSTGPGWYADPARVPGGAWIDHAVYEIDLLRWLFGSEVATVEGRTAKLKHPDLPLEDYGHALFRFQSGALASIEATWTAGPDSGRETLEIAGADGALAYDTALGRVMLAGRFEPLRGWVQAPYPTGDVNLIDHVVACIQGREQPVATVEDGVANLAACLAFYEAVREGRRAAPAAHARGEA